MSGVLAVLDGEIAQLQYGSDRYASQGAGGSAVDSLNAELASLTEVRAAVAELAKCCEVTVKAFEALGRTDIVIAQLEAHRECERALIEQKRALARVQGGQS